MHKDSTTQAKQKKDEREEVLKEDVYKRQILLTGSRMDLIRSLEQEVLIFQAAKTRGLRWQEQS